MSEITDIIGGTVDDRAGVTTDTVVNLTRNFSFRAEIEANPDITLDAELGQDIREQVVLHVRSQSEAAQIFAQDKVRFALFGQEVTMQIISRSNNPANPFVEFRARKLVEDIDA